MSKIAELKVHIYTGSDGKDGDTALDFQLFGPSGNLLASYSWGHEPDKPYDSHHEYWEMMGMNCDIHENDVKDAIFRVTIGPIGHDRVIADYNLFYRWEGSAEWGQSEVLRTNLGEGGATAHPAKLTDERKVNLPPR